MVVLRALLIAIVTFAVSQLPNFGANALAQSTPYEMPVITALTGPIAFGGKEQQITLNIIQDMVNKSGGIQGHPLKMNYLDDQSNPAVAVQITSDLISKKVPLILGPIFTGSCAAAAPLVEKSGPFMYCLTPGYQPTRGGYVFSPGMSTPDQCEAQLNYFMQQHWTRFAILTTSDATGQSAVAGFQTKLQLPKFKGMTLVDLETMNIGDITVTAQLQRIKAAHAEVIAFTGSGPPYGTTLRGMTDSGVDLPVASSSANMTYGQMQQYKDVLPKIALFTSSRGLSMALTPPGPVLDAQRLFFHAYEAAGARVDGVNENVWDPTWTLITALRKLGPNASATQVRDYIAGLKGWVGIRGTYDFTVGDQRGIGAESVVVYRWDPAKSDFGPVSGPAGAPLTVKK